MNPDEQFEKRLQRQPLREVPLAWRAGILSATQRTNSSRHSPLVTGHRVWWRELFWPCPQAWAALAAVWLLIMGLNFLSQESLPSVLASHTAPPSSQVRDLLKQQERLFAELVDPLEKSAADRPKSVAPQPRSARREEFANA